MSNVVIFGGSFDPIHEGHLQLIKNMCVTLEDISCFYIVPSGAHPEGKQYFFSTQERLMMIKLCLNILTKEEKLTWNITDTQEESLSIYKIIDKEMLSSNISYTIDTVEYIYSLHKKDQLNLLVGGDQAMKFSSWYQAEKIAQKVNLWVYPRENSVPDPLFKWNQLDCDLQPISSTIIRDIIYKKDSLDNKKIPDILKNIIPIFLSKRK